jgi:hypothetical protein
MEQIEIVPAGLAIFGAVPQNAESNNEQPVSSRHNGFADTVLACLQVIERGKVTVLPPGRRPRLPGLLWAHGVGSIQTGTRLTEDFSGWLE